jgi:protein tyrosine phosphatase
VIAFSGVALTLWGNNALQKKLMTAKNKERVIDLLLNDLQDFKNLCAKYWKNSSHDANLALDIKIKYQQCGSLIFFIHEKYGLQNKHKVDLNFLKLFVEATGDDFDSINRDCSRVDKVKHVSKLSNSITLELLRNKI